MHTECFDYKFFLVKFKTISKIILHFQEFHVFCVSENSLILTHYILMLDISSVQKDTTIIFIFFVLKNLILHLSFSLSDMLEKNGLKKASHYFSFQIIMFLLLYILQITWSMKDNPVKKVEIFYFFFSVVFLLVHC